MCIFYIWWCGNKVLKTQVPSRRVSLARSQLRNGMISLDTSGWAECCERKGYSHVTCRHNDCVASQSAFKTRKQKYFLHKPKEARRRWNVFTLPRNPYRTENKRLLGEMKTWCILQWFYFFFPSERISVLIYQETTSLQSWEFLFFFVSNWTFWFSLIARFSRHSPRLCDESEERMMLRSFCCLPPPKNQNIS